MFPLYALRTSYKVCFLCMPSGPATKCVSFVCPPDQLQSVFPLYALRTSYKVCFLCMPSGPATKCVSFVCPPDQLQSVFPLYALRTSYKVTPVTCHIPSFTRCTLPNVRSHLSISLITVLNQAISKGLSVFMKSGTVSGTTSSTINI